MDSISYVPETGHERDKRLIIIMEHRIAEIVVKKASHPFQQKFEGGAASSSSSLATGGRRAVGSDHPGDRYVRATSTQDKGHCSPD